MNTVTPQARSQTPRLFLLCVLIFVGALAVRLAYARAVPTPASGDTVYYTMVAENLYRGRGLVSDYAWNYLAGLPKALPVPSNEYWMPGASVAIAGAFALAGDTSPRVAQMPFVVFGALLCAITAWLGGLLFRRLHVALLAGGLMVICPRLVSLSARAETYMLAGCLLNLSLLSLWAAWRGSPRLALLAGAFAGLTYLTRTDGALLIVVALGMAIALFRRAERRRGLALLLCFLAAFALVAAPWWARQTIVFGHPAGGNPLRTAFLTEFNQLFRLDQSQLDLRHYLQTDQAAAMRLKARVLFRELCLLWRAVGFAGLLAIVSLASREARRLASPWLIYLALGLLVPALVFPFPTQRGGFGRLIPSLSPILFVLGAKSVFYFLDLSGTRRRSLARTIFWLAITVSLAWPLAQWLAPPPSPAIESLPYYPPIAREAVRALPDAPGPVLTDSCWRFYYTTGVPCAQFPSEDIRAALQVAASVGATHLITTGYALEHIPAMVAVRDHPRFRPVAEYPGSWDGIFVYQILPRDSQPPPDAAGQAPHSRGQAE